MAGDASGAARDRLAELLALPADDGLLVGYVETPDYQAALAGMAEREVNARWQREMAPFFVDLDGRRPDEGFLRLEQVFHLP